MPHPKNMYVKSQAKVDIANDMLSEKIAAIYDKRLFK